MRVFKYTELDLKVRREELADQFSGAKFGCIWDIGQNVLKALRAALAGGLRNQSKRSSLQTDAIMQFMRSHPPEKWQAAHFDASAEGASRA